MSTDIDVVWQRISALAGETFHTVTKLPFTYEVNGDVLVTSRTSFGVSKAGFAKALRVAPVPGPGYLPKDVNGPSYVWAILHDERVRQDDWQYQRDRPAPPPASSTAPSPASRSAGSASARPRGKHVRPTEGTGSEKPQVAKVVETQRKAAPAAKDSRGRESDSQGEVGDLRTQLHDLNRQVKSLKAEAANLQGQVSRIKKRVKDLQGKAADLQRQMNDL